jgi:energy-converting hydrogenase Eha subunit A
MRLLLVLLLSGICIASELDLPVLKPDDPRRVDYKEPEPQKPQPPVTDIPEPPDSIELFGEEIPVSPTGSIVFVIDASSSMIAPWGDGRERWDVLVGEVCEAIDSLEPTVEFTVVAYDSMVYQWSVNLVEASDDYKRNAKAWIKSKQPLASTATAGAVITALFYRPDRVVLMTDGEPNIPYPSPEKHRQVIRDYNKSRIPIDVIGIQLPTWVAEEFCRRVSNDSGGMFFHLH